MIVVPQEVFERLQSPSSQQQQQQQQHTSSTKKRTAYKSLDQEMEEIMSDKRLDDIEKWKMYNQVLQRFLNTASVNRQPITLPIVDRSFDSDDYDTNSTKKQQHQQQQYRIYPGQIEEIVETFTKTYKPDVRNLLRFITRDGSLIRWDDNFKVTIGDGEPIPNSNLVDLLHSIVRLRSSGSSIPPGWDRMIDAMKQMNVPKAYIRNAKALERLTSVGGDIASDGATNSSVSDEDEEGSVAQSLLKDNKRGRRDRRRRTPMPERLRSAHERRVGKWPYQQHVIDGNREARKQLLKDTIYSSLNDWEEYSN